MPSQLEDIIAEFCELSKREKSTQFTEYQTMLRETYHGEIAFHLPVNGRGLEEAGGRLLEWFFEQYPYMEEVGLRGNMLNEYDGRKLSNGKGFDALIAGLKHLKKLRILDLSGDTYAPEQLGRLAQEVLMNHPTFTTLKLTTASITDRHLDAMTPYLSCPQLKRLSLNSNVRHLTGEEGPFNRLVDKLLSSCPEIQFIDVSGNELIVADGPAARALMRLVTTNQTVFVRIPQDEKVYQQSMKNRYERFIPSRFSVMDMEFNRMRIQYEEFKASIEGLPSIITTLRAHEIRFTQIDTHMEEAKAQNEATQQQIEDAIALQCLKQVLIEKQIAVIHADVREFREDLNMTKERVTSTQVHVRDLDARSKEFADEAGLMTESIGALRRNLARQDDTLRNHADAMVGLNERMESKLSELRGLFHTLEQRMQERWTAINASLSIEEENLNLSPIERAYVKKFKYLLVQIHIVAMTATEGTMQMGSSNTASIALMVLNIVSGMAPGPVGVPIQAVFGYLFQTMDEKNTRQRMEKIGQLGTEPADISRLATTLSQRLIHCFALDHQTKKGSLTRLFSMTKDTINSFTENGFYGALFHAVQEGGVLAPLTSAVRALTIPEIEMRAEQDAKLLLAAVVKEGVPKSTDVIDDNRLFLYAAPTLTVIDRLFLSILQSFCAKQHCDLNNLSVNTEKRQQFYGRVAKSWHNRADVVSTQIENNPDDFITRLAATYSTKTHPDGSIGVFYFKEHSIFKRDQKRHASIHNQALDAQEIEEALRHALS